MTDTVRRSLVLWEARHDNGWITIVMEQPDGTFVAWAGLEETVGLDYVEDSPEHAQAAAMFALKRKSGHASARLDARSSRCERIRCWSRPPVSGRVHSAQTTLQIAGKP